MPQRPYRRRELHDHYARSGGADWRAVIARREPDWPLCPVCNWPMPPAATAGRDGQAGTFDRHPTCE